VLIKTTSNFLTGLDSLIFFKGKLGRNLKEILQIAVMSIEVLPLIFKEAERQLAELKSAKKKFDKNSSKSSSASRAFYSFSVFEYPELCSPA
jgi:hypothetical protein